MGVHQSGQYAVFASSTHLIVKVPLTDAVPSAMVILAGTWGQIGLRNGVGSEARFNVPSGIAFLPGGAGMLVCDSQNHALRHVTEDGVVTTMAGAGIPVRRDGRGPLSGLDGPIGVAVAGPSGAAFAVVTEYGSNSVRYFDVATGTLTTIAGGSGGSGAQDGVGSNALFNGPTGIALRASTAEGGFHYALVSDSGNGFVRMIKIVPGGGAGTVMTLGLDDRQAYPAGPRGIAFTSPLSLVFADSRGNRVRQGTLACAPGTWQYGARPPGSW